MSVSQEILSNEDSQSDTTGADEPHGQDFTTRGKMLETLSKRPTRPLQLDMDDLINLPSRTLSNNAALYEYTEETLDGQILKEVQSNKTGKIERYELVTWKVNDPENPKNWSKAYKWYCTMTVAFTCFVVAFNSAVVTADIAGVARSFDVSREVALLTTTLFVVGFGVGPMVFAPLSEVVGRRPIYATTLLVAVAFIIPGALAQNIATILVARAIDGIAFSAPMTLVGAIGPLVGGFLADAKGWRWLYWIQLILSSFVWVIITFTVPETYTPKLLARRAAKLRKSTGDDKYVTEQDLDMRPLAQRLRLFLLRPFQLLFQELIVFFVSLYMSVLYGLLYMFFIAYPIVYQEGKGYSAGVTGLMFIPLAIGVVLSACCAPFVNKHYLCLVRQYHGKPPPEVRLIPMMASCWCIPIGVFIFAWTSYPHVSWAGPAMGGFVVGFGFIFLYNAANNYLVDSYQHQAASALAAKTFLRSFWGASVVLFTEQMYQRLGFQWASSLIAFIGLGCCAIPFIFYFKGAAIRRHSKYAFSGDEENLAKGETTDPQ